MYIVNMIKKELLYVHELYADDYEQSKAWLKAHDGYGFPIIGLITLPVKVGPK